MGFNRNTHYRNVCYDTANLQIKLSFLQKQKCIIHFVALKTIKGKTLVLPLIFYVPKDLCFQRQILIRNERKIIQDNHFAGAFRIIGTED